MPVGPSYVERWRSKRSMQLGVARRADDVNRMGVRHVGEQRAEADAHRHVEVFGQSDDLLREEAPLQRRLRADDQDRVGARQRRGPHLHRGPRDVPLPVAEVDARPDRGEVGEDLGVDVGDVRGPPVVHHRADRGRGSLTGVVPAGEGEQHHRVVQRSVGQQPNVLHYDER